jgi:hypothetical protein
MATIMTIAVITEAVLFTASARRRCMGCGKARQGEASDAVLRVHTRRLQSNLLAYMFVLRSYFSDSKPVVVPKSNNIGSLFS